MAGRLTEQARKDWQRITSSGGFEEEIIFKTPDSFVVSAEATVKGLATKHNLDVDTDGNAVSSKNVHITVSEDLLVLAGYPVRNASNEVDLTDHKIQYADSTNSGLQNYVILQVFPDETVGMITCILGDSEEEIPVPVYDPFTDDDLSMYYNSSKMVLGESNLYGDLDFSGVVSSFKDAKGTAAFDLIQTITTAKPNWNSGFLICDGVNDFLTSSDLPAEIKNGDDFTFIVIGENILNTSANVVTFQGSAAQFLIHNISTNNRSFLQARVNASNLTMFENTALASGESFVNRVDIKTNWELFSNENSDLSGNLTYNLSPNFQRLQLGRLESFGTGYYTSKYKGLMVFNKLITDTEKLALIDDFINNNF